MDQQTKGYSERNWEKDMHARHQGFYTPHLCSMLREINEIKNFGIISEFWQRILHGLEEDYFSLKQKMKNRA